MLINIIFVANKHNTTHETIQNKSKLLPDYIRITINERNNTRKQYHKNPQLTPLNNIEKTLQKHKQ